MKKEEASELSTVDVGPATGQSRAKENWAKLRHATKLNSAMNNIKHDVRMFGTDRMDEEHEQEEEEEEAPAWFVLLPSHTARRVWDVVVFLLLVYVALVVPWRVAFVREDESWLDTTVNVLFGIDIFINFISAYHDEKTRLITNPKSIALHYCKTWLFIDLVATFPLQLFLASADASANKLTRLSRVPRLFRTLRLLRLLRIVRIFRLSAFLGRLQNKLDLRAGVSRIFKFSIWVVLVLHIAACCWFLMAVLESFERDTWVYRRFCMPLEEDICGTVDCTPAKAELAQDACADYAFARPVTMWLDSLYWSFSSMSTVGYGDVSSSTNPERIGAIVLVSVGFSWFSYTISSLSSVMATLDMERSSYRRMVEILRGFAKDTKLPHPLYTRIKQYLRYAQQMREQQGTLVSRAQRRLLLDEMSSSLRNEVLLHMHRSVINSIAMLREADPAFTAAVAATLQPLMVAAGDMIVRQGDHALEMYFIGSGMVDVCAPSMAKLTTMLPGSYIAENCILQSVHPLPIRARTACQLYAWSREDIQRVLLMFPEMAAKLEGEAIRRLDYFESKLLRTMEETQDSSAPPGFPTDPRASFLQRTPRHLTVSVAASAATADEAVATATTATHTHSGSAGSGGRFDSPVLGALVAQQNGRRATRQPSPLRESLAAGAAPSRSRVASDTAEADGTAEEKSWAGALASNPSPSERADDAIIAAQREDSVSSGALRRAATDRSVLSHRSVARAAMHSRTLSGGSATRGVGIRPATARATAADLLEQHTFEQKAYEDERRMRHRETLTAPAKAVARSAAALRSILSPSGADGGGVDDGDAAPSALAPADVQRARSDKARIGSQRGWWRRSTGAMRTARSERGVGRGDRLTDEETESAADADADADGSEGASAAPEYGSGDEGGFRHRRDLVARRSRRVTIAGLPSMPRAAADGSARNDPPSLEASLALARALGAGPGGSLLLAGSTANLSRAALRKPPRAPDRDGGRPADTADTADVDVDVDTAADADADAGGNSGGDAGEEGGIDGGAPADASVADPQQATAAAAEPAAPPMHDAEPPESPAQGASDADSAGGEGTVRGPVGSLSSSLLSAGTDTFVASASAISVPSSSAALAGAPVLRVSTGRRGSRSARPGADSAPIGAPSVRGARSLRPGGSADGPTRTVARRGRPASHRRVAAGSDDDTSSALRSSDLFVDGRVARDAAARRRPRRPGSRAAAAAAVGSSPPAPPTAGASGAVGAAIGGPCSRTPGSEADTFAELVDATVASEAGSEAGSETGSSAAVGGPEQGLIAGDLSAGATGAPASGIRGLPMETSPPGVAGGAAATAGLEARLGQQEAALRRVEAKLDLLARFLEASLGARGGDSRDPFASGGLADDSHSLPSGPHFGLSGGPSAQSVSGPGLQQRWLDTDAEGGGYLASPVPMAGAVPREGAMARGASMRRPGDGVSRPAARMTRRKSMMDVGAETDARRPSLAAQRAHARLSIAFEEVGKPPEPAATSARALLHRGMASLLHPQAEADTAETALSVAERRRLQSRGPTHYHE